MHNTKQEICVSRKDLAQICGVAQCTVQGWLRKYNEGNPDSTFSPQKRIGRRTFYYSWGKVKVFIEHNNLSHLPLPAKPPVFRTLAPLAPKAKAKAKALTEIKPSKAANTNASQPGSDKQAILAAIKAMSDNEEIDSYLAAVIQVANSVKQINTAIASCA